MTLLDRARPRPVRRAAAALFRRVVATTGAAALVSGSLVFAGTTPAAAAGTLPCGITAVSGGGSHSLAIAAGGTLWSWGLNRDGQVGDGTTTDRTDPVQVPGLTGVSGIAAGHYHSLAVVAGTVRAWGWNYDGQLGDGTTTTRPSPVTVTGLTGVTSVAAGAYFSLALTASGTVRGWGDNHLGQLGDGTTTDRLSPVTVSGLTGVTAIAAGGLHGLAIGAGGTVWAWGRNDTGQLGDGTTTDRHTPVQVPGLTGITAIAAGTRQSLAVGAGGIVYAWGYNIDGQVGDGTTTDRHSPVQVPGLSGVTTVAASGAHSLAVIGGTVRAWGDNSGGKLGDGTTTDRHSPVPVSGLSGVTSVAAGVNHSLSVGTGGRVNTWGGNSFGQLGDGTMTGRTRPAQINCPTAPTVTSAFDNPDPVYEGATLTFWVGWEDPNAGDQARAVICKTDAISSGVCLGGTWASGSLSSGGVSGATYTPVGADVGTRTYYAFACDDTGLCSSSVSATFSVTSAGAPTATSASDSPDPVVAGNTLNFSVGWTHPTSGATVRALICKTDAVSNATCPGGAWATGSLSPNKPAQASYLTTNADVGTHSYYAFACDTANRCSLSLARTFTVGSAAPRAEYVVHTPDPTVVGQPVTFWMNWSDPSTAEQVKAVVCKTDAVSAGSCPGGAWAIGVLSNSEPVTASYTPSASDLGANDYYAFVCDRTDLCSDSIAGVFNVDPPACSDGVNNDGDANTDFPADPGCASPNDNTEGASCPPIVDVTACLDAGPLFRELQAVAPGTGAGAEHEVAGHVDQYRFDVAGVVTTLVCVELVLDGRGVNPCAEAGGTFVTRVTTLVQALEEPVVETTPLLSVRVCHAELTLIVTGNGINSLPAYTVC